jgi:hypothetical protein
MTKSSYTTVRLDKASVGEADSLLSELGRDIGVRVSRDVLMRALVWGVTAPQASGMIAAYIRHTEKLSD